MRFYKLSHFARYLPSYIFSSILLYHLQRVYNETCCSSYKGVTTENRHCGPNSFCLVHLVSSDRFLEVPRMPVSLVHGCWVFTAGDWRLRPGWLPERVEVKKERGMYVRV